MGDEDRDAILARRQRLIAVALAGLAGCGGAPAATPQTCLSVESPSPERVDPIDPAPLQETDVVPVPEGMLDNGTTETDSATSDGDTDARPDLVERPDARPHVCLSPLPPPDAMPRVCLSEAPLDDD